LAKIREQTWRGLHRRQEVRPNWWNRHKPRFENRVPERTQARVTDDFGGVRCRRTLRRDGGDGVGERAERVGPRARASAALGIRLSGGIGSLRFLKFCEEHVEPSPGTLRTGTGVARLEGAIWLGCARQLGK
jgi:hypothetical protein